MTFGLDYQSKNKVEHSKASAATARSDVPNLIFNLKKSSPDPILNLKRTFENESEQSFGCSDAKGFDFSNIRIQPKLKISHPNDPYEQEADRVAEQIMRMRVHDNISGGKQSGDRKCAACEMKGTEKIKTIDMKSFSSSSGLEANDKAAR
ncbi:MAG TPA: hypothetical protein VF172_03465 [Nitrososphaera sp.]|jgi:hypothetical protein